MSSKRILLIGALSISFCQTAFSQGVGISENTFTPNSQAILDLTSDRRGFLPPRLELNGNDLPISGSKPAGLMVYNSGGAIGPNGFYYWTGSTWTQVATGSDVVHGSGTNNYLPRWTPNGSTLGNSVLYDNGTNVGLGTNDPQAQLHTSGTVRLANYTNGFLGTDASGNVQTRSVAVSGTGIAVTNGNGVSGNPTVSLNYGNSSTGGAYPQGNFGQFQDHSTYADFNVAPAQWGWNYVQGNTNAPNTTSTQWYRGVFSLGSAFPARGAGGYSMELAYPRYNHASAGVWMRTIENGTINPWTRIDGNGVSVSGTTNYLAKFTSGTAVGNSQLFDNGTNVGIGSTTPGYKFDVNGGIRAQGHSIIGTGTDKLSLELQGTFHRMAFNELRFYDLNTGGDMVTFNNGNVGVGTTTPIGKLAVHTSSGLAGVKVANGSDAAHTWIPYTDGSIYLTGDVGAGQGDIYIRTYNGGYTDRLFIEAANGNVGIATTTPAAQLHLIGASSSAGSGSFIIGSTSTTNLRMGYVTGDHTWIQSHGSTPLYINELGNNTIINSGSSNVGIGTTNPVFKLHVNGDIHPDGKFVVQNSQDGGSTRGIYMWSAGDSNWGIYMGQSGSGRSLSGGTATAGGGFSQHAIRFRVNAASSQGFIFENNAESNLLSIRGDNGRATFRGGVLFDCPDCGSGSTVDGTSDWGDLTIQGRVLSTNSNLHLSPPGGYKVIINSSYRAAGGSGGTTGLQIEDGGIRMNKSYMHYQRYRYCNCYGAGSDSYDLGTWDFCAVSQVGFKNNQSNTDEDDDVQCAVYPSGSGYGEQTNYTYNFTEAYNSKRRWYMYLEAYEDTNGITCAANCMNFE